MYVSALVHRYTIEVMEGNELEFNEYRALSELRFHIRRFRRFSEEAAREVGLEAQQHQALLAIKAFHEAHGPTVSAISELLSIRHHSAVGLIDRLVERGLAERSRGIEDKRQVRVRLTAAGEEMLVRLAVSHHEELHVLGPALVEALTGVLNRTRPAAPTIPDAPTDGVEGPRE
jgi:DNA-binding MarR family transcriptional regulator